MRARAIDDSGHRISAVLGPTNTGKTHLAIERMLGHRSGLIGLPLRLLAREVYNRIANRVGERRVSLITGEEKIIAPGAPYTVCTVEALPRFTDADFVAIDEVQLADDLERGHIFTDRLLNLRGRQETLLLGAATMTNIIKQLIPNLNLIERPRFSTLSYSGPQKISRLQRRSAIVAFSVDEVYAIAELIRRQRGGAAVVMGALSPRTRNAQVELFQSGDVDFLIATDAIGMGLNLDVDHVAFAQTRKFDGFQFRDLSAAELAQIAGRAGRYMRNGSFGETARVPPFDKDLVDRIETNHFQPVKVLQWRSYQFDFSSLANLQRSIARPPDNVLLAKALPATDARALDLLERDPTIRRLTDHPQRIALLWAACAIPDYRRITPMQHADIIKRIFTDLIHLGTVDESYLSSQVDKADNPSGNLDILAQRIAAIRTWTFVSHQSGWLTDPQHWQEKTREIENRLSDALHERLTKRFVDRRTSVLLRRLRENDVMDAEISQTGDVLVEGHKVGTLDGFRFRAEVAGDTADARAVRSAAAKVLSPEFEARAERFASCANADLAIGSDGVLRWLGEVIASLSPTEDILKPRFVLLADEQLTGPARDAVMARIDRFVRFHFETALKPLFDLLQADALIGITRGIAFQLVENYGVIPRRRIAHDVKSLDQISRAALRRLGVRFGAFHIFLPMMLKPAPAQALTLLWALKNDGFDQPGYSDIVRLLASGRTSIVVNEEICQQFYLLAGYRIVGKRAVRVDILERLADLIRSALNWRPGIVPRPDGAFDGQCFLVTPAMMSILGATADDMDEILSHLGYRYDEKSYDDILQKLAEYDQEKDKKSTVEDAELVGHWPLENDENRQPDDGNSSLINTEYSPSDVNRSEGENVAQTADVVTEPTRMVRIWRYRSRHEHAHKGQHQRPLKKPKDMANDDQKSVRLKPKRDNQRNKKPHVRVDKPRQVNVDPTSPFAALAALRDKIAK